MLEPVVDVNEAVSRCTDQMELPGDDLPDSEVKGTPGVQKETEERGIKAVDGVRDGLGEEESTELVTHARAEELSLSLGLRPVRDRDLPDVEVEAFCDERAGR